MHEDPHFEIAKTTFRRILARFPSLEANEDKSAPVELSINIPAQLGLRYAVNLNLQNRDELHFSVSQFWLSWFPCTDAQKLEAFVDSVCGFLSGHYRVLEHYRGNKCVKAELQVPEASGWRTIGTIHHWTLWPLFPRRTQSKELRNA